MITPSFLVLFSWSMKIINSVVVVGLYYGFLTTFSIGPSYLLFFRALVMEEVTEKKVSATTGFIMGQLVMFISIYYAPLHLALSRPLTITALALPNFLFHFFWNNDKEFFDYGSTTRNSMRNFSIQCVFLNNLIFPLFNHFILPSSMLARLVNIYLYRFNNKMLFVTSGFVGWLIGHILFIKWLGLVLVWIRQNRLKINKYIRSNKYLLETKYLVIDLIGSMNQVFSGLLLILCVYYLRSIPSHFMPKEVQQPSETEEGVESEEEGDVEIETASEMKGTNQEQEGFTEKDPSPSLFSEEKADLNKIDETEDEFHFRFTETDYKNRPLSDSEDEESYLMNMNENHDNSRFKIFDKKTENKDLFFLNKPLVTLFDMNRWNRPFRYLKNSQVEGGVRNEMSQYFFDICQSDGKERISFTYPPSLSIFLEMIKRRIAPHTLEKSSSNELDNPWVYTNKQKVKNFNKEFLNRMEALDNKKSIYLDILETRTRLCNNDSTKEYLSQRYDPFLNGSYRRTIDKSLSPLKNFIEKFGINRIHGLLLPDTDYHKFEQKINRFDKKPLSTEIVTDANGQNISIKSIRLEELSKKVPRWSYKLITDTEQESDEYPEEAPEDHQIRGRKGNFLLIFTASEEAFDPTIVNPNKSAEQEEVGMMFYLPESDFRRGLIKGSMRDQRRKLEILQLYQPHAHSPLFLNRMRKLHLFALVDDISWVINRIFRKWVWKGQGQSQEQIAKMDESEEEKEAEIAKKTKAQIATDYEKKKRLDAEIQQIEAAAYWDNFDFGHGIRSLLLLTQSLFRKYILLPSLIIAKNIVRLLLLQRPEWSEDFQEWNNEVHIKCTPSGVPISETEFPREWFYEGLQIKILLPFRLKPWHPSSKKEIMKQEIEPFCFLTIFGLETDHPYGSPRLPGCSLFKPILKKLEKKIRNLPKIYFRARIVFKEKTKFFQQVSKERKKWLIKGYESSEIKEEKDSIISNQISHESFNQMKSPSRKNSSVTEKKMKDLTDKTSTIRNQIERITKEKKKVTPRINNLSPNKTSSNAKRFEKWQILKRRTAGLIAKLPLFFKSFIQRIYTDIFLPIMNILRMETELCLEYEYNNEGKQEKINKKKKNSIPFSSTMQKVLDYIRNNQIISHLVYNLSCASQAYVFYKLSHQLSNSYKPVLQHQGSPLFLKPEIKASFETQGMGHSGHEMNQWQAWFRGGLRAHYQYNVSQIRWSRLIPEKWRNRVHQCCIAKNENFSKCHSKDQLIDYKHFEVYSDYFQKCYRYDLLSFQFLNYENKKECYRSPFQGNTNQDYKMARFDMPRNIHYRRKRQALYMKYMEKTADRKYRKILDEKLLNFDLRQKVDIEAWITLDPDRNQKTQIRTKNSEKIHNKELMIPEINPPNSDKGFFDWMGMNEKMLKQPIFDGELWFFPKFVLLYNAYKTKPWSIPSNLLLLNLNRNKNNKNSSSTEKINDKEKGSFLIASNKKHRNQEEKESTSRGDLESVLSQQKDIEENSARSDMKKRKNKKENKAEDELDLFTKTFFLFQMAEDEDLHDKIMSHIKIYSFLIRMKDPIRVLLAYRQKLQLNLLFIKNFENFMKTAKILIEPICLSEQKDGQFIMYQTIGIPLVHKSKHQTNQKYQEQRYVSKNNFDKAISAHDRISRNRDKNHFDLLVPENILSFLRRNHFDLLVPENILSFRRRRNFRILISLNSKNRNDVDRNSVFWNGKKVKNSSQVSHDNNHLDREKNQLKLMKLKHFLWPNYRLEDLACMNRYWFDTNNGSRFSMLRIHLYPRLKIRR
uniref:Protein TIC 214 n=1 Tax=Spathodea campanulata TaxID=211926 RepID=A0A6M8B0G7_SPACM|nr:hypothetical protein RF1 [Spathodea campanulata]YP_009862932.1 hypothetical protein RF1 [Spathodea campanulata]QKD76296.1 hypothetical protein RF1 [Spathodea campanulata]QKD76308.1 hypothetical protein RF1 [Spathodea campanulata]